MASGNYSLDLEPPKRNVFVTQLHERDDEEDDVHQFPIVKESAGKLLETGLSTLQKTLLLKKEVEVERVNEELQAKRDEFRKRMDDCAQRQVHIQKKQQRMKDRVSKFEKFIKENEAKRRRAIQKYQTEVKLKEQKNREYDLVCAQLEELKKRQERLKEKLAHYKIFEEYLQQVLEILPAHYLEVNDSMLNSLMMRHRTLSATNLSLVENLGSMVEELERQKKEYEEMKADNSKNTLSINSQLSRMQKEQEREMDRNQEKEQRFGMGKIEFRTAMAEFGQVIMAINNLADKCHRHMDAPLEDMDLYQKLDMVKEYMVERIDVARMAGGGSSSPSSDRRTNSPKMRRKNPKNTTFKY